jgi:hypothetical protein
VPARALLAAVAKRSLQPEFAAGADLSVPERVLLFCVASGTEWERAGVTGATVTVMIVRGLLRQGARRPAADRRANRGDVGVSARSALCKARAHTRGAEEEAKKPTLHRHELGSAGTMPGRGCCRSHWLPAALVPRGH